MAIPAAVAALAPAAGALLGGALSSGGQSNESMTGPQKKSIKWLLDQLGYGAEDYGFSEFNFENQAQLDALEATSLAGLEDLAMSLIARGDAGSDYLEGQLSDTAETERYLKGVADPLTKYFSERVIPETTARFAGNAAFGSDRLKQERQITEDFGKTLESGLANYLETAEQRRVGAADMLNQDMLRKYGLISTPPTPGTDQRYKESVRADNQKLNALLAALGIPNQTSYAPVKDYTMLGLLGGESIASLLK